MKTYSKKIDWLSVTFPCEFEPETLFPTLEFSVVGKGLHGYNTKLQDTMNGVVCQKNGTQEQGTHITLSGDTLENLRGSIGLVDDALLSECSRLSGRASRMDIAIDIENGDMRPKSIFADYEKGLVKVRAKRVELQKYSSDGVWSHTMYAGSRQSERYMRIYEKSIESALDLKVPLNAVYKLRMELELKSEVARLVQNAAKSNELGGVINAQFRDFMQYNHVEYQDATSGAYTPTEPVGKKDTDTVRWLLGVCASTLGREAALDPTLARRFFDAAKTAYRHEKTNGKRRV
jgi:hypothetical protein